jgi:hypothetical protein
MIFEGVKIHGDRSTDLSTTPPGAKKKRCSNLMGFSQHRTTSRPLKNVGSKSDEISMYEFSMVYYGIQWYIMVYYLKSLKSDEKVDLVQRLGYVVMIFHVSFTTISFGH